MPFFTCNFSSGVKSQQLHSVDSCWKAFWMLQQSKLYAQQNLTWSFTCKL